ncbi:MAG: hypothetical protein KDB03_26740 [Planctomycetales bacterium]|nr:hypothetical protein [Planctomycetales bacterium]
MSLFVRRILFLFAGFSLGLGLEHRASFGQEIDWVRTWIFNGQTALSFRKILIDQVELKVDEIDLVCSLQDDQRKKLNLAATGEVSRFFRDLQAVSDELESAGLNQQNDQEGIQKAWQLIEPYRTRMGNGLLGKDSLFQRVIIATLSEKQRALLADSEQSQHRRRMQVIILATIADLERRIPFTNEQRTQVVALLTEGTLPRAIDRPELTPYVGFTILKKNESELSKILDPDQLKLVKQKTAQWGRLENQFGW